MLIDVGVLGGGANVVASVAGGVALAFAIHGAPWRAWLAGSERQWVWFGSMALLLVVWAMNAGITPGLTVRFLLMTALTLVHGWHLAVVAGALVLLVFSVLGLAQWQAFGANLLCLAVVPALFTAWFHELVHARLPHNYFIYFFVTTCLGSALAFCLASLVRVGLMAASGTLAEAHVGPELFAILPLMSFGEAVVNGTLVAMAVIYRPYWVMSFDDRLYLAKGQ
ncbi:MAG: energy-coupling factor ABC transporter permease [Steroidobacteraceae bacterium]